MGLFDAYGLAVVVIGVLYAALLIWFLNGWNSIEIFKPYKKIFNTKVSVIVPFFNEQETLEKTLKGLLNQRIQTTEYEIICVDDHSDDTSGEIAKNLAKQYRRLQYVLNDTKGKKAALSQGIKQATGILIVMTDADCTHHENWLSSIVEYFEGSSPDMIIGPVVLNGGKSILQKFQQIEFASLVGTGAGAAGINHAIMCNGANLAFKKEVYSKFDDPFNSAFISGDDVFLLHNFKQQNCQIDFIKCETAIVKTRSTESLKAFFNQRVRWSSKASGYKDADTLFSATVVFLSSFLLFLSFAFLFYDVNFWKPLVFIYVLKTTIDIIYLNKVSDFFHVKSLIKWLPVFQIIYALYVPIVAISSLFNNGKNVTQSK